MQKSSQIRSHTAHIFPKKKEKPVSSRGLVEGSELHRFPSVFLLQLLGDVSRLSARSIIHIKRRVSLIPSIMGRNTHFIIQLLTSVAPQRDHSAPAGEFALPHARWTAEKNSNWATRMWARTDAPDAGEFRVSFTCVSLRWGMFGAHTWMICSRAVCTGNSHFSPVPLPCLKESTGESVRKNTITTKQCDGRAGDTAFDES